VARRVKAIPTIVGFFLALTKGLIDAATNGGKVATRGTIGIGTGRIIDLTRRMLRNVASRVLVRGAVKSHRHRNLARADLARGWPKGNQQAGVRRAALRVALPNPLAQLILVTENGGAVAVRCLTNGAAGLARDPVSAGEAVVEKVGTIDAARVANLDGRRGRVLDGAAGRQQEGQHQQEGRRRETHPCGVVRRAYRLL